MPGNIFHYAYSQYLNDTKKGDNKQEGLNNLNTDLEKLNGVWVSRYEVIEKPQPIFSKILAFLNNETFMDIIN